MFLALYPRLTPPLPLPLPPPLRARLSMQITLSTDNISVGVKNYLSYTYTHIFIKIYMHLCTSISKKDHDNIFSASQNLLPTFYFGSLSSSSWWPHINVVKIWQWFPHTHTHNIVTLSKRGGRQGSLRANELKHEKVN